jgi:hypothetical protein
MSVSCLLCRARVTRVQTPSAQQQFLQNCRRQEDRHEAVALHVQPGAGAGLKDPSGAPCSTPYYSYSARAVVL